MHELGITQNLLTLALQYAEPAGATQITALHLVIGELSSVVDESVQFYWDMIARGTIAHGAQLHFERLPAAFTCDECGATSPRTADYTCPECGSGRVRITQGEEFYLKSIEIED
ncbi:MAG: hydrogenase maturation nickel metallochaperone HypA [Anaerolineae bacterium]|nr:hydrogenase maturation nickel metallochaperone HypA [Anaerolineae bacterium]